MTTTRAQQIADEYGDSEAGKVAAYWAALHVLENGGDDASAVQAAQSAAAAGSTQQPQPASSTGDLAFDFHTGSVEHAGVTIGEARDLITGYFEELEGDGWQVAQLVLELHRNFTEYVPVARDGVGAHVRVRWTCATS